MHTVIIEEELNGNRTELYYFDGLMTMQPKFSLLFITITIKNPCCKHKHVIQVHVSRLRYQQTNKKNKQTTITRGRPRTSG